MSRDSSVVIATGYGLHDHTIGVRFPVRVGNFSPYYRIHTDSGAHPASYPMDARGSFPRIKRPEREADP
jgi:hypothetical protein